MTDKTISIYQTVKQIINPLYLVGGSVRDCLLNKEPKDYDFATPHLPDDIEAKVKQAGRRAYLTGKKYGTIGFKVKEKDKYVFIEVTTFRTETYQKNNRKPEVEFINNITKDLSRRDFRFNAIAWRDGKLIDPFCGRLDILEKKIRSVGHPSHRIKEDPLRMLRCARFMAQLDFDVDDYLMSYVEKLSYKILHISKERWVQELDKLLLSNNPSKGLEFLAETRLLNFIIPELSLQVKYDQNSIYHNYDLWTHTLKVVEATPKDINLRWSALLHDIAKPFVRTDKKDRSNYIHHDYLGKEIVDKIATYLKWSNDRRKIVKGLVENHLRDDCPLREYDNKSKNYDSL